MNIGFPYKKNSFGEKHLMGTVTRKSQNKTETYSYKRGKEKAIAKRRAQNKVARHSRRLNQIRANSKCCKFFGKG